MPMSPPADEPDGSPQSPFSRHGKFQSSVRAELTSYQFKVNIDLSLHLLIVSDQCCYHTVIFCHTNTQDEKQCSSTVR